MNWSEGKDLLV